MGTEAGTGEGIMRATDDQRLPHQQRWEGFALMNEKEKWRWDERMSVVEATPQVLADWAAVVREREVPRHRCQRDVCFKGRPLSDTCFVPAQAASLALAGCVVGILAHLAALAEQQRQAAEAAKKVPPRKQPKPGAKESSPTEKKKKKKKEQQ